LSPTEPHCHAGDGQEIVDAIRSLKAATLLRRLSRARAWRPQCGSRGGAAVQDFALAHADRLIELDINPLIVRASGRGAVAADVLIRPSRRNTVAEEPLRITRRGTVLEIVLDRPKATPSTPRPSRIMGEAFARFRDDPSCASPSSRAPASASSRPAGTSRRPPPANRRTRLRGRRLRRAAAAPRPRQAGHRRDQRLAVGGGFELALSADLILAANHARFALPEIKSGTIADAATLKLPRRIPYHVAMDLLFTGGGWRSRRRRAGVSSPKSCRWRR